MLVPKTKETHDECVFFFFSHNDLSFSFALAAQSSILNPVVWIRKMNFSASRPLISLLPMTPALLRHQELLALHILHLPLSVFFLQESVGGNHTVPRKVKFLISPEPYHPLKILLLTLIPLLHSLLSPAFLNVSHTLCSLSHPYALPF